MYNILFYNESHLKFILFLYIINKSLNSSMHLALPITNAILLLFIHSNFSINSKLPFSKYLSFSSKSLLSSHLLFNIASNSITLFFNLFFFFPLNRLTLRLCFLYSFHVLTKHPLQQISMH